MTCPPRDFLCARPSRSCDGFSLVEILVVVAIISVLAAFAVPAFSSIGQARGVSEAAFQVSSAVELARSEAIARQTYVWLGFQEEMHSGNKAVRVGIVYSRDGSTNATAANIQPLGRSVLIQRVGIVESTKVPGSPLELADFAGGVDFQISQSARFTDKRSLTFTPLGEVMRDPAPTTDTPFEPLLAVGLATSRGNQLDTNNVVSIAIDGSVGIPTTYQ